MCSIPVVFLLTEKYRVVQLLQKHRGWSGLQSSAEADSGPGTTAADCYYSMWKCFWLRADLADRRKKKNEREMKKRALRSDKAAETKPHYSSFLSHPTSPASKKENNRRMMTALVRAWKAGSKREAACIHPSAELHLTTQTRLG